MQAISEVIQLASCYNSCVAAEQLVKTLEFKEDELVSLQGTTLGKKITNEMQQFKITCDVLFREVSWHVADIDQGKHGMHNILYSSTRILLQ